MQRPRLVCLLPARNCAHDLPGWFASVERFADAVVALDDGSTDATACVLEQHPLTRVLLRNPRREDYRGWDDAANRQQLLDAASATDPDWLFFLDADERLDPAEGAALRALVDHHAARGDAYLFRVGRMIGDEDHYDPDAMTTFFGRLFPYEPGQVLPNRRLHDVPLPTSIPRSRWRRTTIRIQHLANLTDTRRLARVAKYAEADPDSAFNQDYTRLLQPPGRVVPWAPRSPLLPLIANSRTDAPIVALPGQPLLSAIVISKDDEATIERTVRSVVTQECPGPFEVIVVTSGTDRTAAIVRERFPEVRVVELDHPALPGEARNAGLREARGVIASFPGSHVELPPGSLAARMRAHQLGYAMVTGPARNGTRTAAGWAAYFLGHNATLPGRPAGPLDSVPIHCSYLRAALDELDPMPFPEDRRAGEDTVVNEALFAKGYGAYRTSEVLFTHHTPCRTPAVLVRHLFVRGRAKGRMLLEEQPPGARVLTRPFLVQHLVRYVPDRLYVVTGNVAKWGGAERPRYGLVFPLVVAGAAAYWAGIWFELARRGFRA